MFNPSEDYKKFSDKLTKSRFEKKGIKKSELRKFAKQIIKSNRWSSFINEEHIFFEDVITYLFVVGEAPIELKERFNVLESSFHYLDNWAFVDGLCTTLKEAKTNTDAYWDWLQTLKGHENPFVIRFIYVMYLNYFLDTKYFDEVLKQYEKETSDHYYIKMAIAWGISFSFVKNEEKTLELLKKKSLPKWTHNKSIQKIRESLRVDQEKKDSLLQFKL